MAKSTRNQKVAAKRRNDKESPVLMPLRFGNDPLLWASWLYYEESMTQGEVANTMGVSRASVNTYLSEARSRGIVDITIQLEMLRTLSVAVALKEHYGLQDCLVIPGATDEANLIERLGHAGAMVLDNSMQSGDVIATGWGRTVRSVVDNVSNGELQDMRVVQALGALDGDQSYSSESCARRLSRALGGECTPISAPACVSSSSIRKILMDEPLISSQLEKLSEANRIVLGISSLRPSSTIHTTGLFSNSIVKGHHYSNAVGSILGAFIDDQGQPVNGPLNERLIGMELSDLKKSDNQCVVISGGFDKIPAMLATLRGGYANVLITDVATGQGILNVDGIELTRGRLPALRVPADVPIKRTKVKKLLNDPSDAVKESLEGAVLEHARYITTINGSLRALKSTATPKPGKVGLVIGGGSGHEPCFLGYVGSGMADAVAIGNIFASPPPGPIVECTLAADNGAGVLYVYGNYSGDIMNFSIAADMARTKGVETRTVITTDDIASSSTVGYDGRRGVAGNIFAFKIAGAACERMLSLSDCEAIVRRANSRTYTMGVALEPCSHLETRRPTFTIGDNEIEVGVGIHGEPGVERLPLVSADQTTDLILNKILAEMNPKKGDSVALLVNSLGGTPMLELYIINRRIRQRLRTRGVEVHASWTGHYCTSLDMVGISVSLLHLDSELESLLDDPCDAASFSVGRRN